MVNRIKGKVHPVIKGSTRLKHQRYFEPHNKMLFKTIGKRFYWMYASGEISILALKTTFALINTHVRVCIFIGGDD